MLRCENLSPDPAQDWIGRALSEILSAQLWTPGSAVVLPTLTIRASAAAMGYGPTPAPGISTERDAAIAAGANRLITCDYTIAAGKLRVSAAEEDTVARKILRRADAAGALLPAAAALARQFSPNATPFPTTNEAAIRAYTEGIDSPDAGSMRQAFTRATAADPNFALAYLSWAEAEAARQDRAAVLQVVALAQPHRAAFSVFDRARVDLLDADLRNDVSARARALSELAKTGPPDANVFKSLGDIALTGRRYRESVNYYRQAVALAPADMLLRNILGYAETYLGDYDAAIRTLAEYGKERPNEANPLDSQADVNFYFNRYAEAEKLYLQAYQKDPNFLGGGELWKAAQARFATGDVPGATEIFNRYAAILDGRHDPAAPWQKASWQFLIGRRREAMAMLEQASNPPTEIARLMRAQLVFWQLQMGDSGKTSLPPVPPGQHQISPLEATAIFLTQPLESTAAAVEQRAQHMFGPASADLVAGYALLFHSRFSDALPLVRHAWEQARPDKEEGLSVLLAWAMIESDKWDGVTSLIGPSPIPSSGVDPFLSIRVPRLYYLRGRLFEHQQKKDLAVQNYGLFVKLSPQPDIWDGEARAAQFAR